MLYIQGRRSEFFLGIPLLMTNMIKFFAFCKPSNLGEAKASPVPPPLYIPELDKTSQERIEYKPG